MKEGGVDEFFEQFLDSESLFKNKKAFQSNYTPEAINHRDKEIEGLAQFLAPCLKLDKPSNIFIYGKTGTGKTLCVHYVTKRLLDMVAKKNLPVKIVYLNCKLKKIADTEYRIIAELARQFGKSIPPTGLPTDEVYNIFYAAVNQADAQVIVFVLDEIDQLIKKIGDEILYNLTRINSELKGKQISLVGISNDLLFTELLDPRVRSSLSEEEVVFPPYNAVQIQKILKARVKEAFQENAIAPGVIEKCAAYAAREHGDARRALELLRVAAEVSEREKNQQVKIDHLDLAEEKIEKDKIVEVVTHQPKQSQLALYSIIKMTESKAHDVLFTGDIYELYSKLCPRVGLRPLTQRRVSDIIAEMDMLGIIRGKVVSKGRYGRTREIHMTLNPSTLKTIHTILAEGLALA